MKVRPSTCAVCCRKTKPKNVMNFIFYFNSILAIVATILAITRINAVHALLYLILSFLSVAMVFYSLGAIFIAALEVIVYAGAIVVLFIFVIMMLNPGPREEKQEKQWLILRAWLLPTSIAILLLAELLIIFAELPEVDIPTKLILPNKVGLTLFGPYLLGVELASVLLLAGLVGAFHLGKRELPPPKFGEEA